MGFKKNVLLTGAGFTANFGGFLAREMWSKILNNKKIDELPEIKKLLMNNFDFEEVYSEVINQNKFTQIEKDKFQAIISDSYGEMDETLKTFQVSGFNQYGVYWAGVKVFLTKFIGSESDPGIHFTLNQDLLLERCTGQQQLGITAVKYRKHWDDIVSGQIDRTKSIQLPDNDALQEFKDKHLASVGRSYYVKLHGSQQWQSYTGKAQMVLGINKLADIEKEPLLSWYLSLFKDALYREGVTLFVIGYSFRDKHINDVILEAIDKHELQIIVISPEDPTKFKSRMEGRPECAGTLWEPKATKKIWEAVRAYFPYALPEIFPEDQTETHIIRDLNKFFS